MSDEEKVIISLYHYQNLKEKETQTIRALKDEIEQLKKALLFLIENIHI